MKDEKETTELGEDVPTKCNANDDCGEGYKCVNGKCVKDNVSDPTNPPPIPPAP